MSKERYLILALAVALGGAGYYSYKEHGTSRSLSAQKGELEYLLTQAREEKTVLEGRLSAEQEKTSAYGSQLTELTGTVDKLSKLAKTDPELLKKYSKVYFLNEHYSPKRLIDIPEEYLNNPARQTRILASTSPYLLQMASDAKQDGIELRVVSAYRSFAEQTSLKSGYSVTYGSGANSFSADQGYSEHQLGTAVDLTTAELGNSYTKFDRSEAYKWMQQNAYKYGFILSYPKGNAYYVYEPWHWRFVGKLLAERLHEERENFYDLDQRKIDAYLVTLFD